MKYVISDIHGESSTFFKMLEKINFSTKDELYIIGDIMDRGEDALSIIEYIRKQNNIYYIKGNHEEMFMDFVRRNDPFPWINNGGLNTYNQIAKNGVRYMNELYDYINTLPFYMVVDKYILVHAGLEVPIRHKSLTIKDLIERYGEDNCLWSKDLVGKERKFKDYTIICGHTPTQVIPNNKDKGNIFYTTGTIYIDCGCGFDDGHLGCLCLDTMEEFYVEYD